MLEFDQNISDLNLESLILAPIPLEPCHNFKCYLKFGFGHGPPSLLGQCHTICTFLVAVATLEMVQLVSKSCV